MLLAFFALPALGQRHGGGFVGHPGSGFRGPAFVGRGPGFGGARFGAGVGFGGGFGFGTGFRRPFFSNRFGRGYFVYGYPWGYPYAGSYYVDPGYYADYNYPAMQPTFQGYNTSASYFDKSGFDKPGMDNAAQIQQQEIDRLESEVDRLREERERRTPPAAPEPQSLTVLVFHDKHSEEVQNYAVVGQTLWIFSELRARKIPISELDISATTKANEDRGIDFRLPE